MTSRTLTGSLYWLNEILPDKGLDPTDKILMIGMANHVGEDDCCFVGIQRLAEIAGCCERTARTRLKDLEDRGYIKRDRRRREDGNLSTYLTQLLRGPRLPADLAGDHRQPRLPVTTGNPDCRAEVPSVEVPSNPLRAEGSREDGALFEVEPKVKPRPSRKTDPVFEAVLDVCNIDAEKTTTTSWALIGKVVRELKAVGAEPHEVLVKATTYRKMFPGAVLTPTALQKHWGSLQPEAVPVATTNRPEPGRGHVPDPRYPYRRV